MALKSKCDGVVAVMSVTKRCRKLSGHNVVEGKGLQKYSLVMIHDDEYSFCVRRSGKLNEDNGGW